MSLLRWMAGWVAVGVIAGCSDDASEEDAVPVDAAVEAAPRDGEAGDAAAASDAALGEDDAALVPGEGATLVEHATITPRTDPCVASPGGIGAYGAIRAYDRYEIDNPAWTALRPRPVEVLVPASSGKHPVLVYSHPFGGDDWTRVRTYLELLVSLDHVVIFTPYPTVGEDVCGRYDTLRNGLVLADKAFRSVMDVTRAGFIGHSFGAGASPWLAHEAVTKDGWGSAGLFLYANAPWYVYRMAASDWSDLPASTRLVLMLFHEDDTNDHRIGIDQIFAPFPYAKSPRMLQSSAHDPQCALTADHIVPATDSKLPDDVRFNALDTWGTLRYASALSACTFRGDAAACAILDGSAADALQMGSFQDGSPVATMLASDTPAHESSYYQFPPEKQAQYPCTR